MVHWKLSHWCAIAVHKIHYPPDRDAVYEELRQHLDDRSEEFLAQGMTKEEAIEKTLEAMGDSHELAVQLAAIHRPFWGFAYSITKWILRVVAVIAALLLVVNIVGRLINPAQEIHALSKPYQGSVTGNVLFSVKQNAVDSSDGYTFSVHNAYVREDTYIYSDGTEAVQLYLLIEMTISTFNSIGAPIYAEHDFWGTDNQGRYYGGNYFLMYSNYISTQYISDCVFKIPLETYEDLTWFELCYTEAGRNLVLHIDLTGGDRT